MKKFTRALTISTMVIALASTSAAVASAATARSGVHSVVGASTLQPRTFGSGPGAKGAEYFLNGKLAGFLFDMRVTPQTYTCVLQKQSTIGVYVTYTTIKRSTLGGCSYKLAYGGAMKGVYRWYVPAGNGGTAAYSSTLTIAL